MSVDELNDATQAAIAAQHEVGISGIARYGSISRIYDEFLRELQGPKGMRLYKEAIDNCPIIGAFLFAMQHLCRQVDFRVEPAKGKDVDKQQAHAIADRVRGALFDDLDVAWPDLLSEILTMVPYGWSLFEMTYKRCQGVEPSNRATATPVVTSLAPAPLDDLIRRQEEFTPSRYNDGWLSWKSWGLRPQDTLFMWEWDPQSRPLVMQQMAPPDYNIRRIPLTKSLLFRTQVNKGSPEGRSAIRNAMPSYLFRKNIQVVEGIGIERDLAGYPVFQVKEPDPTKKLIPPDIWNDKDPKMAALLANITRMVKAIRRDEQEGAVLPYWLDLKLVSTGSRRQFDTNAIITRYDQRIAMTVMADFILIGHDASGSKALAGTKSSLFTQALNSFLTIVCSIVNRFAIPQLLRLNGVPIDFAPTLTAGEVENIPIDVLGDYVSKLAGAGMNLFPNPALQESLLTSARLPTVDTGEEQGGGFDEAAVHMPSDGAAVRSNAQGGVA